MKKDENKASKLEEQFDFGLMLVNLSPHTKNKVNAQELAKTGFGVIADVANTYFEDPDLCPPPLKWPPRKKFGDILDEIINEKTQFDSLEVINLLDKMTTQIKNESIKDRVQTLTKNISK